MEVARKGQLLGPASAPGSGGAFDDVDGEAGAGEDDGCRQAIRPGANDDGVGHSLSHRARSLHAIPVRSDVAGHRC